MKKQIALATAAAMVLGLAACGSKPAETKLLRPRRRRRRRQLQRRKRKKRSRRRRRALRRRSPLNWRIIRRMGRPMFRGIQNLQNW